MMIPRSVIMFLGQPEAFIRATGALGCVFEYEDESHDIAWDKTQIVVSSDNDFAHYHFAVNQLQSYRSPGSYRVRVSLTDYKSYVNAYDSIREFLMLFERRRRSRLGPRWDQKPWHLNARETFVIQMSDEEFGECFICDPRSRVAYAAVMQQRTLLLPIMKKEPEGFPFGGVLEGPSDTPRTEFPAHDL